MKYRYSQEKKEEIWLSPMTKAPTPTEMENYTNGKLFDKNMKFCILVVHDLTNDISYDTKLNRSKNGYFWGKIVKIMWKKSQKIGKYF